MTNGSSGTLVVVLGHDLWTAFFAADAEMVGRTIRFRNQPVTVVGVAGPNVRESPLTGVPELWMPLSSMPALFPDEPFAKEFLSNATRCCVDLVGRFHPGLSRSNAAAVVLMAWMATIVPMRRALRVDPAATLRHE